jgi:hypothetical protein
LTPQEFETVVRKLVREYVSAAVGLAILAYAVWDDWIEKAFWFVVASLYVGWEVFTLPRNQVHALDGATQTWGYVTIFVVLGVLGLVASAFETRKPKKGPRT